MMSDSPQILPPYPRLGEIYRALAVAIDTKATNRDVDRLAREGEFDWSLLPTLGEELVVSPLAKFVDAEFADLAGQFIQHIHKQYLGLVSAVPLDELSREEALPLLVELFFAPRASDLIYHIKNHFDGPDLMKLFDPGLHPVAVVMEWLGEGEKLYLAKVAFPDTTTADRSEFERVRKWTNGTNNPDLQSIALFGDKLSETGLVQANQIKNLRIWLMIARAVSHLERKSPIPFRPTMREYLLLGRPKIDIGHILSMAVTEAGLEYSELKMHAFLLKDKLSRTTAKLEGDQAKTLSELEEFEHMTAQIEPEGRTQFRIEWLRGRWYALSGDFGTACSRYERAAQLADYRAGNEQKRIVEEALILAGHMRKKAMLKKLKNRAVAFGLFSEPRGNNVMEDWEIEQLSRKFHELFPPQGQFKEVIHINDQSVFLPFKIIDPEFFSRIKPDLRNPDRVVTIPTIDGQRLHNPQLHVFVRTNSLNDVNLLLSSGASVNKLNESSESALICAIQEAADTNDRRILDVLLEQHHSKETINTLTKWKRFSPLFCAIDLGEPDVVEKLLTMGADANFLGNIPDESPLYFAINRATMAQNPNKLRQYLYQSIKSTPDLELKELIRRYNIPLTGAFGDGIDFSQLLADPINAKVFNGLTTKMVAEFTRKHSIPKLIRIIELLLLHKADPNARHSYPAAGRTPFMLAAENDLVEAFDLMLKHRGNPFQNDATGLNCLQIANGFNSTRIIRYMRSKGIWH